MIGLIGTKVGMTQYFTDDTKLYPATIIKIEKNIVINRKINNKDGYNALVLGSVDMKEKRSLKPYKGQFVKGILPKKNLKEFKVDDIEKYEVGQEIGLEIFDGVNYLDVIGTSKGKGFQGVMKRHGFSGGPASHGSKFHRQNGSTGQSAYPSRVFKGLKRAGRMGNQRATLQNLKIIDIDNEKEIIIVKGAIPGNMKGIVYLKKALKKK